jgi:hypothetical protein
MQLETRGSLITATPAVPAAGRGLGEAATGLWQRLRGLFEQVVFGIFSLRMVDQRDVQSYFRTTDG